MGELMERDAVAVGRIGAADDIVRGEHDRSARSGSGEMAGRSIMRSGGQSPWNAPPRGWSYAVFCSVQWGIREYLCVWPG
jgi:hypothetical protein